MLVVMISEFTWQKMDYFDRLRGELQFNCRAMTSDRITITIERIAIKNNRYFTIKLSTSTWCLVVRASIIMADDIFKAGDNYYVNKELRKILSEWQMVSRWGMAANYLFQGYLQELIFSTQLDWAWTSQQACFVIVNMIYTYIGIAST